MPGNVATLMVNEPSLKGGKNERPSPKKATKATTKRATVVPITTLLWRSVQPKRRV